MERLASWSPCLTDLETAILQAVVYADVFDYPLTLIELHRFLVGVPASKPAVLATLKGGPLSSCLSQRQGQVSLRGRETLTEVRRRRAETSALFWPRALRYGSAISRLPFVRMVAVTGALAMDNVEPETDIDYVVITEPGRLWLCRALVVLLVRAAARRGDEVCPNYFLSQRALALQTRNLFTAHELAQMVPVAGLETHYWMWRLNRWAVRFLPNAFDDPPRPEIRSDGRESQPSSCWEKDARAFAERAMQTAVGGWLEQWEMDRKVRKYASGKGREARHWETRPAIEVNFDRDRCKGHFDSHGQRTLEAFGERLRAVAQAFPEVGEPLISGNIASI